ncbi:MULTISPECIES: N-acetyl sugar amidotransferase [Spirulina sp. CCY15215]|uniref:N-acetyl sugar amidotransferase n=1 Tax=Spirulina sp. CCY15215 TaxID=2767591 RepID=UPI0019520B1B
MKYCTRCLYPGNHPLHLTFDEAGVCSGCRIHEEKDILNWEDRSQKLKRILDNYRSSSHRIYDCIVPVSGARDTYFILHVVKNIYGMNPLLVTYNKHYNTQQGLRNLAYLRTLFNCDLIMMAIGRQTVQKITKSTIKKLGSIYWHCLAGQTVYPVQTAVKLKIPLIIWGVHQGCDQVGMFSHLDEVEMTRKYRKEHDLMGWEAEDLVDEAEDLVDEAERITEADIHQFIYPHDKDLEKVGVRGIYLSNYIRWDSKKQHEFAIAKYQYETALQQRTFDTYNDIDCIHYSGLHDYIKFLKYGYGKVMDHACREIRLKRLTREEGIQLIKQYQLRYPKDFSIFSQWVGMSEVEILEWVNRYRDPQIWQQNGMGKWKLRDSIINHKNDVGVDAVRLEKVEECQFTITPSKVSKEVREDRGQIWIKGYVD